MPMGQNGIDRDGMGWLQRALACGREWSGVPHLEGVACSPILRSDGTVLQTPGYDAETGLYLRWEGPPLDVPADDDVTECASGTPLGVGRFGEPPK